MYLLPGLVLLLLVRLVDDLRLAMRRAGRARDMGSSEVVRAAFALLLLLAVPPALVASGLLKGSADPGPNALLVASAGIALAISFYWYRYLAWLDSYEPERRWQVVIFFAVCALCTFTVWPITAWAVQLTGLRLTGGLWGDWWYAFVIIGGVEELVKLVPVLLVLRFTRWINEPFDLLFYGCISALGFAFVENTLYLEHTGLHAMAGRALMASVSHMFDTSVICYGLALMRAGLLERRWWWPPLLYVLACAAHGFYDLWLLAPGRPELLTLLFYFGTMHLWVVMKNNLINLSPHFRAELRLGNTAGRYRILNGLLAIFMLTYLIVAARQGSDAAAGFLTTGGLYMCATLSFLSISFSSYTVVRGYLAPLRLPLNPVEWVLPRMQWGADLAGRSILVSAPPPARRSRENERIEPMLPMVLYVVERAALGHGTDWYLANTSSPIVLPGYRYDKVLVRLHEDHEDLDPDRAVLLLMRGIRSDAPADTAVFDKSAASKPFRVFGRDAVRSQLG